VLLASAIASLMIVVMPGTQAHADPTVTEIEAQITKIWGEAEPLIEEYNGVHEKYKKTQAQQADLAAKIEPLQRQVELGQAESASSPPRSTRAARPTPSTRSSPAVRRRTWPNNCNSWTP